MKNPLNEHTMRFLLNKKWLKTAFAFLFAVVCVMIIPGCGASEEPSPEPTKAITVDTAPEISYVEEFQEEDTSADQSMVEEEPPVEESYLEVHYIDVGQGNAALLNCDGETMLIDGGKAQSSDLIYTYLKEHGITELNYIVASHPDEDHIGGLAGALNYATAECALSPVVEHDTEAFQNFKKYLELQEVSITVPNAGDTFMLGSAEVQVLGPFEHDQEGDSNNNSIVLKVTYEDTSFLFTGDAELEEENEMLETYDPEVLKSDVLLIGHHGSSSSTSQEFLDTVSPQYAVISVGADNSYGHPTAETLNKLEDAQVELFRTDWNGNVVCTSDGASLSFSQEKEPEMLTLPGTPESYEGQHYQDVVSAFAAAGFTNVQAIGSEIDPDNSWKYSGAVVSVMVGTATIADTEAEYAETTPISIAYITYDEEAKEKLIAERKKAEADAKKKAEKKSEKKSEKKPAKKTEEKTQPEEKVIPQTDYVLNTNTKKFHYSYCKSVKRMKEKNTSYFTGARSDVIAMGYSPCQNCNP